MTQSLPILEVLTPGLLSTVQDSGRVGFQQQGIPEGGAMDLFAAAVANALLGNAPRAALLETTLTGPSLCALRDVSVAITGADLSPAVDGVPVPAWHTLRLRAGQILRFGRRESGARAYLAVAGGVDVPTVLGSRATFLRGGFGGYAGRALRAGDILRAADAPAVPGRGLRSQDIPRYEGHTVLRALPGPHAPLFTPGVRARFWRGTYTVSPQSDRMGYRLVGPALALNGGSADMTSEAVPWGAVQVAGGQPLLLLADRQTVGGYPVIAVVISADRAHAAQMGPGDAATFRPVTLAAARRAWRAQEAFLRTVSYAASP